MDDHSPIAYDDAMARAAALAEGGRLPEATAAYRRVAADHPHQPGAHYELGILHHQLGEVSEAIACFERAAALMPRDASIWNNLGVLHYAQGNDAKAEQCLRQAVALDGGYAEAWFGLGRASERAGRRGDAVVAYRACLSADASQGKAARSLEELQDAGAGTLKVGFVSLWYERGQAYVTQMLRNAVAMEHETYVLARNDTDASRSLLTTAHEWAIPNLTTHPEYALPRDLIRQWITDNGVEVVFFNEEYDLGLVQAAHETGARTIGIYYWELFDPAAAEPVNAVYDAVICPTRCSYERFRALGITRAVHVPWGIDTDLFRPVDRPVREKVRFFHPAGWGGLHARRGTQAVIDAFREADLADAELLVHTQHGEGIEREGNITIRHGTVPREELVRMYQESDVAVLPSKWEGLGLTFLEAMGCGLPIITLDAPPMSDFVVDGETGILCPVSESTRYEGIYVEGVDATTADLAAAMARLAERETLSAMRAATLCHAPEYAWSERGRAVLEIVDAVRATASHADPNHHELRLPRKHYAGCKIVSHGSRRFVQAGEHKERATIHLLAARRSGVPWGMATEAYRALELAGYRVFDTDWRQEFADLASTLQRPAHLLLAIGASGVPPTLIQRLPCPTVLWYPDDITVDECARDQLARYMTAFDRVYTVDPRAVEEIRRLGVRDARWLPPAVSPVAHHRMYLPKVYDVCVFGDLAAGGKELLAHLSKHTRFVCAKGASEDVVRLMNQSRIVLNLETGSADALSRTVEALGCGCFVLSRPMVGEPSLFVDRQHLVCFTDDDAGDLIAHYLAHDDERDEIAQSGYVEVHAKHTYANRIESLMADAMDEAASHGLAELGRQEPALPRVPDSIHLPATPASASGVVGEEALNVALYAPVWQGEMDEVAAAHAQVLRSRGHTVTLNRVDGGCEAVIAYGDFCAGEALIAARAHGLPLYAYVLDIPAWRLNAPEYRERYERYREVLRQATEIIALSEQTRSMVREFVARDARVCYLGLPMTQLDLTQPEYDVEELHQVAFLSRLVSHKHPEVVIEAIGRLESRPRLVLMARSGDQALMETCQALAGRLKVDIEFKLGLSTPEVARELRRSRLLVSASTFEGFGMSPGEALYCGKPAIVTDLPVFHQVYRDHVEYFPAMDVQALASQIDRLLTHAPHCRWLGEQGQHFVMRHYTMDLAAQRFESLLRALRRHEPVVTAPALPNAGAVAPIACGPSDRGTASTLPARPVVRYAGPIYNVSGYSKACRLNILAIQNYGDADVLPLNLTPANMDYRGQEARDVRAIEATNQGREHDTNIYHCNLRAYTNLYEPGKRNLVYTVYESTVLQDAFKGILVGHDWQLIVPSDFVRDTFTSSGVPNTIHVVPHVFRPYEPAEVDCLSNLNGRFKFYTVNNWTPRKNIPGLLHAYFHAFTEDDNVVLLIKTFRLDFSRQQDELIMEEFAAIRREYSRPPLVSFLFGVWDEPQIAALHHHGDVFVSATHGEAWGLTGFEAMGYGKPVIQTCWSGMATYMRDECCYPVREGYEDHYSIPKPYYAPVGEGDTWFYPDMDRFSELMRHCYEHPDEAAAKGRAAQAHILRNYSLEAVGARFREVLRS